MRFHLRATPLFAAALTLSSCVVGKPVPVSEPAPRYDFIEDIPMESNAGVKRSADIRAYPVGRYVDAANKNVMHERHVIYRRERPEQWRLNADQGPGILLGPTVGLRNPVAMANPVPQELTAELNKQRLITRQLISIRQQASSGDERARILLAQAGAMKENQDRLIALIKSYNARLDSLQNQLDAKNSSAETIPKMETRPAASTPPVSQTTSPEPAAAAAPESRPEVPTAELEKPGLTLPLYRR